MPTSLLDTLAELAQAVSKELDSVGLLGIVAEAAQKYAAEIEEIHEGDFLKLTEHDREARQKEMEKYPVGPSVKDTQHKVITRQKEPGYWTDRAIAGTPKTVGDVYEEAVNTRPTSWGDGAGDLPTEEDTYEEVPDFDPDLPTMNSFDAHFGLGIDGMLKDPHGSTRSTVFPSVGLYEMLNKLTEDQKDGLIQSLGKGRWVKLDTLKKVIDRIDNPGPRFNMDPDRPIF